jgi:hypothetical protein
VRTIGQRKSLLLHRLEFECFPNLRRQQRIRCAAFDEQLEFLDLPVGPVTVAST